MTELDYVLFQRLLLNDATKTIAALTIHQIRKEAGVTASMALRHGRYRG